MKNPTKKVFAVVLGIAWQYSIVPVPIVYFSMRLQKKFPFNIPEIAANRWFFVVFLSLGIFWTVRSFWDLTVRGKGTIIPFYPPKKLVTSGSYAYCRNPLYLGYVLFFAGASFLFRSLTLLLLSVSGILGFLWIYMLSVEERVLLRRHGETYLKYREETSFLLPPRMKNSWDRGIRAAHTVFLVTVLYVVCLELQVILRERVGFNRWACLMYNKVMNTTRPQR